MSIQTAIQLNQLSDLTSISEQRRPLPGVAR